MKFLASVLIIAMFCTLSAYVNPTVTNATASQRTDGSDIVDIWYTLFDADGDLCTISLVASNNNGASYNLTPTPAYLSGNIGNGQISGTGKHIVWNAGAESYDLNGNQFRFKIIADDHTTPPPPANFVLVTGNGSVGSFYMDKYELTNAEWFTVMGTGTSNSYPRANVNWFKAIEYCNRRSMNDMLTPCYSYGTYGTDPNTWPAGWNLVDSNHLNVSCDFSANGYRLPTVAEWFYAASGGLLTHGYIYSGSNTLSQVGWYVTNSGGASHPVAQKLPNELGIYDMSGNISEWCWDIVYSQSRAARGGFWGSFDWGCTNNFEDYVQVLISTNSLGFRIVRRAN